jgi:alpha-galactosidase
VRSPRVRRRGAAAPAAALLAGALALAGPAGSAPVPPPVVATARTATPPMGWNSWNAFGCAVDEQDVEAAVQELAGTGLRDAGYRWVTVDDCWAAPTRDAAGRLRPDPVRFPHGIAALAALAHRAGLRFGLYSSAGSRTCTGAQPGSLGTEETDAATFAAWGVDYLKYDNCGDTPGYGQSATSYAERFRAMAVAIADVGRRTGRTLVYSVCEWGAYAPWRWAPAFADLWRTTPDIADSWASVVANFRADVALGAWARPGAWNDPDMLEVGNGGMTEVEQRSSFALWAVLAAPLVIGTDLRAAGPATLATLGNRALIAVDQDPLGVQAHVVSAAGGRWVLARPLAGGDVAVALFNATDAAVPLTTTPAAVGARGTGGTLTDLATGVARPLTPTMGAVVPPHGTVVYRLSTGSVAPG